MTVLLLGAALAGTCIWAAAGAVAATLAFIGMVYLID
jgi:hypothetical protein